VTFSKLIIVVVSEKTAKSVPALFASSGPLSYSAVSSVVVDPGVALGVEALGVTVDSSRVGFVGKTDVSLG
jgi:hypothetical protein